MNKQSEFFKKPDILPVLDENFHPAAVGYNDFCQSVSKTGKGTPLVIAIERNDGLISNYKTIVFNDDSGKDNYNYFYIERLVKTLLWLWGGWKITIGGNSRIGGKIKEAYKLGGHRDFDVKTMSRIYGKPFTVLVTDINNVPETIEETKLIGRHLDGCRIGIDLGGSDYKICAIEDNNVVFFEEIAWCPKEQADPQYHHNIILKAIKKAASKLPRVEAIGVSAAGIYINNNVKIASLFIKVPDDIFEKEVKNIFFNIQKEMGNIPLKVINDGDVGALAGSMLLKKNGVLGLVLGTSLAGGYINLNGTINNCLNEFAFIPIDYSDGAYIDEWSKDKGCGSQYLSQVAAIRLAEKAGVILENKQTLAEKLEFIQEMIIQGDERIKKVFETIGCYLGYTIAYLAQFYEVRHILILGRVTTGEGGKIILQKAKYLLDEEFWELSSKLSLHLPDESRRRMGQAIAAASLPIINKILLK